MFVEKYDGYYDELIGEWEAKMEKAEAEQDTQQIFRDGQGDNLPPCSQDFTDYWHDGRAWSIVAIVRQEKGY